MLQSLLKGFFGFLSALSPVIAAKLAFMLFCRTLKPQKNNRKQANAIAAGKLRLEGASAKVLPLNFGDIAYYWFKSNRDNARTVCIVHGWNSQAALMTALIDPLQQAGYDIVLVDLPGYGSSSGRKFTIPMGVQALAAIHEATGPWYAVAAHSLGGAVTTSLVSSHLQRFNDPELARLVLISSPDSIPKILLEFAAMVGLNDKTLEALHKQVLRVSGQPVETFFGRRHLDGLDIRTLVLHAPDDKEVAFSEAESLATAGSHVTLRPMAGLGHRRILQSDLTHETMVNFLV